MTKRKEVPPAPVPLETYAKHFDHVLSRRNQRDAFRRYLEGLLLPTERHKTLTGLSNSEPVVGAQEPRVQTLQWFLSESTWPEREIQMERLKLLREDPSTAPTSEGVLVIDETGDRKDGHQTAHVNRQYLANLGKVDNGVVSVTSLWADSQVYYPLDVEPYSPDCYFECGKKDPAFRTKPQIALQLVQRAAQQGWPFRAVTADSLYGENKGFRSGLRALKIPYVVAVRPSHAWCRLPQVAGSLHAVARQAGWGSAKQPGQWQAISRTFRDGSQEQWWAVEIETGPYGKTKAERAVVATTDPATLPDLSTWYLVTNLPAPKPRVANGVPFAAASLEEVIRIYGLRMWVEQSYKHIKHALGWSQYQVRSDRAIRRHWQLVCCAFSFCWYHASHWLSSSEPAAHVALGGSVSDHREVPAEVAGTGKKNQPARADETDRVLAGGSARRTGLVRTLDHAAALLEWLVRSTPTSCVASSPALA